MKLRIFSTSIFLLLISSSLILPIVGLPASESLYTYGTITYGLGTPDLMTCQRIDGTVSEVELREIARNFDVWYQHTGRIDDPKYGYGAILKDEDTNMFVGFYIDICFISDTWSTDMKDIATDEWFLKDADGNILRNQFGFPSLRLVDPGNPLVWEGYADYIASVFNRYPSYGWVMLDDCWITLNPVRWGGVQAWPINPRTGLEYTDAEWHSDRLMQLRAIKNKIGDRKTVGNICWDIYTDSDLQILDEIDGTLWEDLVVRTSEQISTMLPIINSQWVKKDKIWISWMGLPSGYPEEQMSLYLTCFHLMISDENTYLTIVGNEEYPNQYKGNLGQPLEDYQLISGTSVYARQFEKAWVLFNPSSNTQEVTIDGMEVTMEGHTGKIIK